ncbi:MAG: hypothetical protein ACLS95_02220 [Clostridia bacterium]
MKKEKGVTLVALVITMIILIILAGISINTLVGDDGIITKAKQAKQNILLAGEAEALQLNQLYYELETGGELTEDEESNKKDEIISLLQKQVEELQKQIASLQTENEELKKQIQELTEQIGQIQQEIENLKQQIINKDIEIAELKKQVSEKEAKIQELQNQLNSLNSLLSQTNATADKILAGYKAYSGGKLLTGTMINRGAITSNLNAGQSYTVPQGYHNGAGKVIANSLDSQTLGTATTEDITQGKTAWVNGQKIVGTKQQEDVSAIYVKEMNMGSGGARICHILYDISNANVSTISFQIRRGTGSRAPSIYFSEDGVTFIKIAQMTLGAAYEYVDESFEIPTNYNFVKLEWEIDDNRAWFANIKFK